jgi:hypothetical protein
MVGVSRVFLPFVLTCIALVSDPSRLEPSAKKPRTESPVVLAAASTPTTPTQKLGTSIPVPPATEQENPAEKSPSIIQMLEGRESDLLVWLSIAVVSFMMGWIFGGNYYLRRDRVRRRKLRF